MSDVLEELVAQQATEIERLRAALADARSYLEDIGDFPEPGDTIKMIDAVLSGHQQRTNNE